MDFMGFPASAMADDVNPHASGVSFRQKSSDRFLVTFLLSEWIPEPAPYRVAKG